MSGKREAVAFMRLGAAKMIHFGCFAHSDALHFRPMKTILLNSDRVSVITFDTSFF
jgi:hypothetical protein